MPRNEARWLNIREKIKAHPNIVVSLDNDFRYVESDPVDASIVLHDPTISLYGLDPEHKRVVFIKTDSSADIYSAPFMYVEQYEHAERLLVMPDEVFHELAAKVEFDPKHL